MTAGIIRVGIAGWTFAPWRGVFYPKPMKREHELEFAASQFRVLELTETFHASPRPEVFERWASQVPANFIFTTRAPRLITHVQRLIDSESALAYFVASGLPRLDIHLGPIVWQLPPNLRFDPARIEPFLRLLPHDTRSAAALGRKHGVEPYALAGPQSGVNRPLRHAIDVRHDSFRGRAFIDLLRAYNVALVLGDAPAWPRLVDVTADFVYCRLHGPALDTQGTYESTELDRWVRRIKAWASGEDAADGGRIAVHARRRRRDVFVIFDNAKRLHAPANALELVRRLRT